MEWAQWRDHLDTRLSLPEACRNGLPLAAAGAVARTPSRNSALVLMGQEKGAFHVSATDRPAINTAEAMQ
jgi:hypothetical protein